MVIFRQKKASCRQGLGWGGLGAVCTREGMGDGGGGGRATAGAGENVLWVDNSDDFTALNCTFTTLKYLYTVIK